MGGRGASSSGGGGISLKGGATLEGTGVVEFDGALKYGNKDTTLTPQARKKVEAWEAKRVKNKVEYAYAVNADGTPIGKEVRGSKGSVSSPHTYHDTPEGTFTHIHPRDTGSGVLGGTFSYADMRNFANTRGKTTRAAAKEGTYSMSKTEKFDADGFRAFAKDADTTFSKNLKAKQKQILNDARDKKISWADSNGLMTKAFNTELVNLHNTYLAGQKKYGYKYTLEKR